MNYEGIIMFISKYVSAYFSKQMIHELPRDNIVCISITCARVSKQLIHEIRRDDNGNTSNKSVRVLANN